MKRGNELVDLRVFRERLEKVTERATQSSIEEKAGIKTGGLSRIYSGVDALTVDHLIKLSNACDCSIDYLLGHDAKVMNDNKRITAPFVVDLLDTLSDMDYIKFDMMEWEDYSCFHMTTMKVRTNAVLIRNASLNTLINNYVSLKKALVMVPSDLENDMYKLWKDSLKDYKFTDNSAADAEYDQLQTEAGLGL